MRRDVKLLKRISIAASLALASLCALAKFDSAAWNAMCADDTEVNRLKAEYARCMAVTNTAATQIELPIEQYPDGKVKSRLKAEKAKLFLDTGIVWGEGITVEQYDENGAVTGSLRADNCVVDRKKVTGWVPGGATATVGDVTVSGRGIFFSFKEEFVKITADAQIIVKSVHVDFGRLL